MTALPSKIRVPTQTMGDLMPVSEHDRLREVAQAARDWLLETAVAFESHDLSATARGNRERAEMLRAALAPANREETT